MATAHVLFLAPTGPGVGLKTVALGLVHALDRQGLRVGFFKPLRQPGHDDEVDASTHVASSSSNVAVAHPFPFAHAEGRAARGLDGLLLEEITGRALTLLDSSPCDVLIVEGLVATADHPELDSLNVAIATALDADVVFVSAPFDATPAAFAARVEASVRVFEARSRGRTAGVVVNKVGAPPRDRSALNAFEDLASVDPADPAAWREQVDAVRSVCPVLGVVPWSPGWMAPRVRDLAEYLKATPWSEGEWTTRRVSDVVVVAHTLANMVHRLRPGTLIVTPGDRDDVIVAVAMAAVNGVRLAGLVLTGGITPDARVMALCRGAFETGLPTFLLATDSYATAARTASFDLEVPPDDVERTARIMDEVAGYVDVGALVADLRTDRTPRMSPAAFMHRLVVGAREIGARIVLPEGAEPRTVQAAARCAERGIATCVLLASRDEVQRVAEAHGIVLGSGVEVVEPTRDLAERYVDGLIEARRHKGMTAPIARAQLEDPIVLGTMMLHAGDVDGLVSGAVHTTAHTVRPALQIVRARSDARLVSSVFFMCLPDQVLVYGDCAINPDPDAEELADIAIQSAASAEAFGIEPRVAMISYATGASGEGADVDKVRAATHLARARRPDLQIDGPLQYDAASTASVARTKAPDSAVAGRATVLVFPDLNTGNTTYKAVQRSANVVSIGPMLQGLRRPVNDLSRGATVDDIVYTIALTAIQAGRSPAAQ